MTPIVTTKDGCEFARIAPGGFALLAGIWLACHHLNLNLEITAGTNDHVTGRHPAGEAYDLSTHGLGAAQIAALVATLKTFLEPAQFGIWYESAIMPTDARLRPISFVNPDATAPHLHLQVRKGTTYPPPTTGVLSA